MRAAKRSRFSHTPRAAIGAALPEVGVELGVGGVARGADEMRRGVQAVIVGGVVEVRGVRVERGRKMAVA
jgi:hypothetical protein